MAKTKTNRPPTSHFTPDVYKFLKQLKRNNDRDWFHENKDRYEAIIREPALAFIAGFQSQLDKISPAFVAVPKKVGGSLMRPYRDTRFAKDKTPFKSNVGIHFRHELGKDVHAPGFYVHIAPDESFLGAGIWHPDSEALRKIRLAIDTQPTAWKKAIGGKRFRELWELTGSRVKTVPRGYDKQHPLIDDLRRKDFIGVATVTPDQITSADFSKQAYTAFKGASPLVQFLCDAMGLPF